jgi:hypothetical protein
MEVFYCPDLLKNLAIEAIGKLVSDMFSQLAKNLEKYESLTENYVEDACSQFHELFKAMVPVTVANEVTIKLLRYVDLTYGNLCVINVDCDLEFIGSEIVCAIIHPHVMRLDFKEYSTHPDVLDQYKIRTPSLIYGSLDKLKNLKVLNLGDPCESIDEEYELSYVPKSLKRFSSWVCSNKDIKLLSKSCKGLESLDFKESRSVSDDCLKFLIKFRHLKELNLSGTMITERGLTWILNALCSTSGVGNGDNFTSVAKQLVRIGFDCRKQSHINLLASEFRNLRSLSLEVTRREIHLTRLRELQYLSNFRIGFHLGIREEDIKLIGPQLKCLDIDLHTLSELKWIYDYCPRLQCLHLHLMVPKKPGFELMAYFERFPLPEFQCVEFLHLSFSDEYITDYIVSRFVNIKKLCMFQDNRDSLFENIVQRKQLRHLEQFFWGDRTVVEFSGDKAIITTFDGEGSKLHSTQLCNS